MLGQFTAVNAGPVGKVRMFHDVPKLMLVRMNPAPPTATQ